MIGDQLISHLQLFPVNVDYCITYRVVPKFIIMQLSIFNSLIKSANILETIN